MNFLFLLQRCHTSLNSLLNNSLSGVIKVALVATNADFNEILTQNSRKDATKQLQVWMFFGNFDTRVTVFDLANTLPESLPELGNAITSYW